MPGTHRKQQLQTQKSTFLFLPPSDSAPEAQGQLGSKQGTAVLITMGGHSEKTDEGRNRETKMFLESSLQSYIPDCRGGDGFLLALRLFTQKR